MSDVMLHLSSFLLAGNLKIPEGNECLWQSKSEVSTNMQKKRIRIYCSIALHFIIVFIFFLKSKTCSGKNQSVLLIPSSISSIHHLNLPKFALKLDIVVTMQASMRNKKPVQSDWSRPVAAARLTRSSARS